MSEWARVMPIGIARPTSAPLSVIAAATLPPRTSVELVERRQPQIDRDAGAVDPGGGDELDDEDREAAGQALQHGLDHRFVPRKAGRSD